MDTLRGNLCVLFTKINHSYLQTKERYRQGSGGVTQLTKSLAQVKRSHCTTAF